MVDHVYFHLKTANNDPSFSERSAGSPLLLFRLVPNLNAPPPSVDSLVGEEKAHGIWAAAAAEVEVEWKAIFRTLGGAEARI